jgi:hypothetical protein
MTEQSKKRAAFWMWIEKDPVRCYRLFKGDWADYVERLPDYMRPGVVRYILFGVKPGSFLCAIFAAEWHLAGIKADAVNAGLISTYRELLASGCPSECWGSSQSVREWCVDGGLLRGSDLPEVPDDA